ncbi:MAG TPA: hypothetical protein PK978_01640 [Paludibacter sp.]|nr:hypothetical protein [Paludibacter sp.]HOS46632.1 hypothetical protein [Paludibacter sp.]HPM09965.1 hypothetical protein [Paludibacter sp.]
MLILKKGVASEKMRQLFFFEQRTKNKDKRAKTKEQRQKSKDKRAKTE